MVAETPLAVKVARRLFTIRNVTFEAVVLDMFENGKVKTYTDYGWKWYWIDFIMNQSEPSTSMLLVEELVCRGISLLVVDLEELDGFRVGFSECSEMGGGTSGVLDETHPP